MDDSIVFGSNIEEHDKNLEAVLERIEKSGLKVNREKCQFRKEEVKYFGHLINKEGVRPNPEKVQAIRNLQTPKSLTELRTVSVSVLEAKAIGTSLSSFSCSST